MTTTIIVKGKSCQHCVASVSKALSAIDGISDVQVDLEKGIAVFQENMPIDPETIKKAIAATGFEVVDE
jgi:copper chaperone